MLVQWTSLVALLVDDVVLVHCSSREVVLAHQLDHGVVLVHHLGHGVVLVQYSISLVLVHWNIRVEWYWSTIASVYQSAVDQPGGIAGSLCGAGPLEYQDRVVLVHYSIRVEWCWSTGVSGSTDPPPPHTEDGNKLRAVWAAATLPHGGFPHPPVTDMRHRKNTARCWSGRR